MMTKRRLNNNVGNGLLIVLCGPSGVGKGTVIKKFLENNPSCALSVSATTRPPREGEVHGRDYFFISRERFGELVAKGEMLEYAEYNGNYYGTPKVAVEKQLEVGKNVILEIEVQGFLKIKEMDLGAVFIFLMPPSWETLRQRLMGRNTDTTENISSRLKISQGEIEKAFLFDYVVINDSLDKCLRELSAIVTASRCRADYQSDFIKEVLDYAQTVDVPNH